MKAGHAFKRLFKTKAMLFLLLAGALFLALSGKEKTRIVEVVCKLGRTDGDVVDRSDGTSLSLSVTAWRDGRLVRSTFIPDLGDMEAERTEYGPKFSLMLELPVKEIDLEVAASGDFGRSALSGRISAGERDGIVMVDMNARTMSYVEVPDGYF